MRDKRHKHKHNRPARGFDTHSASSLRKTGGENRRKANWRFFDARRRESCPFEPHFRPLNRASGITGKHIRTVEEHVRASHGKQQ